MNVKDEIADSEAAGQLSQLIFRVETFKNVRSFDQNQNEQHRTDY